MTCIALTLKGIPCKHKKLKDSHYCGRHLKLYKYDKPDDCPICMESIKEESRPLNCGHWVHKECLLKWNDICPTCRTPVKLTRKDRLTLFKNTNKLNEIEPIHIEIELDNLDQILRIILQDIIN